MDNDSLEDFDRPLCRSALAGYSVIGTPRPSSQKRKSAAQTSSLMQVPKRKKNELCPAECNCMISLYPLHGLMFVCLFYYRSRHTFFGEEGVSSFVARTGGFAERSPEEGMFRGQN